LISVEKINLYNIILRDYIPFEKYRKKNGDSNSVGMSNFRFFLLRDLPACWREKSADSSCRTHVRRIKADGNYGGGSVARIPSPDIPRDPTSPEIKVPSYWLKGMVKFTDTAMRRAKVRPFAIYANSTWTDEWHPSFDQRGNGAVITFCPPSSVLSLDLEVKL